jgi:hypothetical protein
MSPKVCYVRSGYLQFCLLICELGFVRSQLCGWFEAAKLPGPHLGLPTLGKGKGIGVGVIIFDYNLKKLIEV